MVIAAKVDPSIPIPDQIYLSWKYEVQKLPEEGLIYFFLIILYAADTYHNVDRALFHCLTTLLYLI